MSALRRGFALGALSAQASWGAGRGGAPGTLADELLLREGSVPQAGHATVAALPGSAGVCVDGGGVDLGDALWSDTDANTTAQRVDRCQPPHRASLATMVASYAAAHSVLA